MYEFNKNDRFQVTKRIKCTFCGASNNIGQIIVFRYHDDPKHSREQRTWEKSTYMCPECQEKYNQYKDSLTDQMYSDEY